MTKEHWRPAWDREGRVPHWATDAASKHWHNTFGGGKYLWGNTPAVDVLNLDRNEGTDCKEDIALLFAGQCFIPARLHQLTDNSIGRFTPCHQDNRQPPR